MPDQTEIVFEQILQSADAQLTLLLKATLEVTLDDLRAKANSITKQDEQDKFIATNTLIAEQADAFIGDFKTQVIKSFSGKMLIDLEKEPAQSLALVDDNALNESIHLHSLTNDLSEIFNAEIRAFKRGIVRLSGSFQYEPEPQTLAPRALFDSLQKILIDKDISIEHRKSFFDNFEVTCKKKLGQFYHNALKILQDNEIIAPFENPLSKSFDVAHSYKNISRATAGGQTDQNWSELEALDATIQKEMTEQRGDTTSQTALPIGQLQNSQLAQADDKVIAKLLYQYLSNAKPDSGSETLSGEESAEISDDKLIQYLSTFQHQLEEMDLTNENLPTQKLHAQVSEVIDGNGLSLSQLNVTNLIQKLFDVIADDVNLDILVANEILRLQVPYLKVALLDLNILNDSKHPAREVLNAIADIGLQVDDDQDPNFLWIRNIINFILANFERDISVFEKVLTKLTAEKNKLDEEAEQRAAQQRSKAEKEAKMRHLKKRVLDQLHKFIANKQLPQQMYELVLKGFAPLFIRIYVKHGENSAEWQNAVDLFRKIIESVQPRESIADINKIVQHAPTLISEAKTLLGDFLKRDAEKDLLNGLKHLYKQRAEELKRRKAELATAKKATRDPLDYKKFDGEITLEGDDSPAQENRHLLNSVPDTLKEGTMCEVYLGKQLGTRRLKVLSIVEDSGQIIFVDGTGSETRIKELKEFLDELDCERSQILEKDNLFDKALTTVLMNIEMMKDS